MLGCLRQDCGSTGHWMEASTETRILSMHVEQRLSMINKAWSTSWSTQWCRCTSSNNLKPEHSTCNQSQLLLQPLEPSTQNQQDLPLNPSTPSNRTCRPLYDTILHSSHIFRTFINPSVEICKDLAMCNYFNQPRISKTLPSTQYDNS